MDPDGREIIWESDIGVTDDDIKMVKGLANEIMISNTEAGKRFSFIKESSDVYVTIRISKTGQTEIDTENWDNACNGNGSNSIVSFNITDTGYYKEGIRKDLRASLAHEVSGQAYNFGLGNSTYNGGGKGTWEGLALEE